MIAWLNWTIDRIMPSLITREKYFNSENFLHHIFHPTYWIPHSLRSWSVNVRKILRSTSCSRKTLMYELSPIWSSNVSRSVGWTLARRKSYDISISKQLNFQTNIFYAVSYFIGSHLPKQDRSLCSGTVWCSEWLYIYITLNNIIPTLPGSHIRIGSHRVPYTIAKCCQLLALSYKSWRINPYPQPSVNPLYY